MSALPVEAILPDLLASLATVPNAVVIAPPGAGKTTVIAPALLDESWATGQIWLLGPRRLAVRAAAERIAEQRGEKVGGTVGYATRLDSQHGPETRLLVMTHGLFRNRIIADPELTGVSAVLFDEVHERSIDSDFGLALAIDAQSGFRPDLRLLAMSATVDGDRFSHLLGNAPQFESLGKLHPLSIHYLGRNVREPVDQAAARAINDALREPGGDILVFLPGVRDIVRTANRVRIGDHVALHLLHGQVDAALQRAAIRRDPDGRRKVILASAIAESSLTIDGVSIVIDAGLARRARYDPATGLTRLVTERASQAAATQRAGRAARQMPGTALRLWEEAAIRGMPPYDPPEIMEADLSSLLLDSAVWGVTDPATLAWIDPPPPAKLQQAQTELRALGAVDTAGRLTPHGAAMAQLPVPPALAHMMIVAGAQGGGRRAGELAVLLGEQGIGGKSVDLEDRLRRWRTSRAPRDAAARQLAERLGKRVGVAAGQGQISDVGELVAIAYPDRLARRRSNMSDEWLSVGGRAFRLDPAEVLAGQLWLAIADAQGGAGGARITAAAPISEQQVMALFAGRITKESSARYLPDADRVEVLTVKRLGAIRLSSGPDQSAGAATLSVQTRLDFVADKGLGVILWGDAASALRARASYAGLDVLGDTALQESAEIWLAPLLEKSSGLRDISTSALLNALQSRMGWEASQKLDKIAPAAFSSPASTTHAIDYAATAGPTVTLRVQALFGFAGHPVIGQPAIPLILSLTSPAGHPIQTTRDLPGFWAGSWRDVQRDMRGRYPKHNWPDDPAAAVASLKTKAAQARGFR